MLGTALPNVMKRLVLKRAKLRKVVCYFLENLPRMDLSFLRNTLATSESNVFIFAGVVEEFGIYPRRASGWTKDIKDYVERSFAS